MHYILDEDGMEVLMVIANINRVLTITDNTGDIKQELKSPKNNRWIINLPNLALNVDDTINYKFAMRKYGRTYFSGLLTHKVKVLMQLPAYSSGDSIVWPGISNGNPLSVDSPTKPPLTTTRKPLPNKPVPGRPGVKPFQHQTAGETIVTTATCNRSVTILAGKPACKGALIFEDNFDTFNKAKWKHVIKIADKPDYEFCIYDNQADNSYVKNGILHLVPTLTDKVYDKHFMTSGLLTLDDCTGSNSGECEIRASFGYVMPAVISSSLRSTFPFQYGRVEIRAKMALGDWLLSRILLQPYRSNFYGPDYVSGQIRLAMTRGNKELKCQGIEEGISKVFAGIILGAPENEDEEDNTANINRELVARELAKGYAEDFHIYHLNWLPDKLVFSVDGKTLTTISPPDGGFYSQFDNLDEDPWKKGSNLAPFDREFVVKLNLASGGILDFPDNCISSGKPKPWKNLNPKARLNFYQNQSVWSSTWTKPSMEIDYVKIWAL